MKIIFTTLFLVLASSLLFGQFPIGTRTIIFEDPTRTGGFPSGGTVRQIQCEIYYPAVSAGNNVAVATGEFPVVVFGHGFAMSWDAYQNIWEEMVPKGYIMVFPRTESGIFPTPVHEDFGKDLAIVEQLMVAQGNLSTSPFYQKLSNRNAIMGHSMGGGATILAAANNTSIKTIIGLAPAETNPSAIAAAENVTVPALILSGGQDGVTPPADHHLPIYNALDADCKTFVNLVGGAHCYFANSNFNCDLGEGSSSTGITLTRVQQQQKMYDLITPWLAFYLKGECVGYTNFETAITATGLTNQHTCNYTPYTVSGVVTDATSGANGAINVTVTGATNPITYAWSNSSNTEDISGLAAGTYTLVVTDATCSTTETFVVGGVSNPTGLMENTVPIFSLVPNPTSGDVLINFSAGEYTTGWLSIYTLYGQLTFHQSIDVSVNQLALSLNELASGVYFIQLSLDGIHTTPVKLIKN
jgi:dienelactone hydrolase